jgi:hypothetical protein
MILFRRVVSSDLYDICRKFKKIYFRKISKKYYTTRYFNGYAFTSFIALKNNKIISHVGFTKKNLNLIEFKNKYLYSRHTSFTDTSYRNLGIYSNLCLFAFTKLKSSNNLGYIVWPNNLNYSVTSKMSNAKEIKTYKLLFSKYKSKFNQNKILTYNKLYKQLNKFDQNLFINNKYKILNDSNLKSIFKIDSKYIKKEYSIFSKNYFLNSFYLNNKKSYIIYNTKIFSDKIVFNVLYYFGNSKIYNIHLNNFIEFAYKFNARISFWFENKKINNKDKHKFDLSNNEFNILYIGNNKKMLTELKKNNFYLGDTDVFSTIN